MKAGTIALPVIGIHHPLEAHWVATVDLLALTDSKSPTKPCACPSTHMSDKSTSHDNLGFLRILVFTPLS